MLLNIKTSKLLPALSIQLQHIDSTMLSTLRARAPLLSARRLPLLTTRPSSSAPGTDRGPINDPGHPNKSVPNVSATNAVPVSAAGLRDKPFIESVEDAEAQRTMQAPNRAKPWSKHQRERSKAMVGPRFEQTIMDYQVCGCHPRRVISIRR
jgi:NADH dehydrogenase (ubiquinone) Fe-S protein 6